MYLLQKGIQIFNMARRFKTEVTEEKKFVLYELVARPDGTTGIGNTIEVSRDEAILMIKNLQAKSASAPIGEVPSDLLNVDDEGIEENVSNNL